MSQTKKKKEQATDCETLHDRLFTFGKVRLRVALRCSPFSTAYVRATRPEEGVNQEIAFFKLFDFSATTRTSFIRKNKKHTGYKRRGRPNMLGIPYEGRSRHCHFADQQKYKHFGSTYQTGAQRRNRSPQTKKVSSGSIMHFVRTASQRKNYTKEGG
jgi:hypothetical protein